VTYFDFGFFHEPLFMVLAPGSTPHHHTTSESDERPLFVQHPESESAAVVVLVNSRLLHGAIALCASFGLKEVSWSAMRSPIRKVIWPVAVRSDQATAPTRSSRC
jgi:hypothetical protein